MNARIVLLAIAVPFAFVAWIMLTLTVAWCFTELFLIQTLAWGTSDAQTFGAFFVFGFMVGVPGITAAAIGWALE